MATSASSRLARRVGGHTAVYALTAVTSVLAGLLSVAVLTRYLDPSEFGRLAVLLVTASILMILFNLGTLQGTFSWVYGTSADDDDGDIDGPPGGAADPRRALTTGLVVTTVVGCVGVLVVTALGRPLADLLLGRPQDAELFVLAAIGAALAAAWRLGANAIRLERRPIGYLFVSGVQHLLWLALAIPLLASGGGLGDVLAAMAAGNAIALALALVLIRHSLRPSVSLRDAKGIFRRGRALVPVVFSVHVIQLADVLILSGFASAAQVGLYRVASRIGATVSYATSSFHMAWGPLRRDPLYLAADAEHPASALSATLTTYFVLLTSAAVLFVTALADQLVRLASPAYASAAGLIPVTATAFAMHGVFVLAYRTADFPDKRRWFIWLACLSAAVFVLSSLAWIPLVGAGGAAAAAITGWVTGTLVMVVRGQRGPAPVPYDWTRLAACVLLAAACGLVAQTVGGLPVELLALAAYPVGIIGLRIVPLSHVRAARDVLSRDAAIAFAEDDLPDLLLRRRADPAALAETEGISEEELMARFVADLRRAAAIGEPRDWDAAYGRQLVRSDAFATREAAARSLLAAGADPGELDALRAAAARVSRRRAGGRRGARI